MTLPWNGQNRFLKKNDIENYQKVANRICLFSIFYVNVPYIKTNDNIQCCDHVNLVTLSWNGK